MTRRRTLPARAYTKTIRSKKRVAAERFFRACSFLYYLFYWENNAIDTTRFEYRSPKIPQSLDGLKICQVSDLHGKSFGPSNRRLLDRIRAESPDLIAITGDLIDERSPFPDFARETVSSLVEIAPTFYTTGNHEGQFVDALRAETLAAIAEGGAHMLDDRLAVVSREPDETIRVSVLEPSGSDGLEVSVDATSVSGAYNLVNSALLIGGVPDPESTLPSGIRNKNERFSRTRDFVVDRLERLKKLTPCQGLAFVLLSHRPEQIAAYASSGADLVFCGHAHGGQFRLPWLLPNGLNAPHQGYFPTYTSGRYVYEGTTEIVSRGLGPSVIPTRLFNRPNLVVCTLTREEASRADDHIRS